ncbi:MAG: efflux RND transporter periplasmic adaptor subunit [Saprospiraceae bacterium]|nr:efflux RND transporter periplasmic adaptor subunit [Saprospiraceae bacterium]
MASRQKSKKGKRNYLLISILLIAILGLVGVAIWQQNKKPKGERVAVEPIEKRTIIEKVAASGKVFPQTEVKISSDVSGEIVELYVEEGDSVVANQVLAKIDPDAYQSQVERGVASVNAAKAQLANSRSQIQNLTAQKEQIEAQLINAREIHKRNESLKKEGVISDQDYDASLSNVRALEANLKAAEASIKAAQESAKASEFQVQSSEASLKELRTSLNRTTIYAPMNGIVSMLSVEKGERVVGTIQMTGTEMMRIANLNAMEVRVDVSENDIPRVSIRDEVDIEVDAYINRKFKGRVTQIANSASGAGTSTTLTSDQVTNFEVRISIDQDSYADLITETNPYPFRPGMSSSVEIYTEKREGILSVPIQAVTTREKDEKKNKARFVNNGEEEETDRSADDLKEVIFVAIGDTVRMQEVTTGIQDDTYIELKTGGEDGQEVVTAPYSAVSRKLKEGDQIMKVKEDELYKNNN